MTKSKSRGDLQRLLKLIGFAPLAGRSMVAPVRTSGWTVDLVTDAPKDGSLQNGISENDVACLFDGDGNGEDWLSDHRSNFVHHYQLCCQFVEGPKLVPDSPPPPPSQRVLYSALDMHTGEVVYDCHTHHSQDEPNLLSLSEPMGKRPWMMLSWVVVQ